MFKSIHVDRFTCTCSSDIFICARPIWKFNETNENERLFQVANIFTIISHIPFYTFPLRELFLWRWRLYFFSLCVCVSFAFASHIQTTEMSINKWLNAMMKIEMPMMLACFYVCVLVGCVQLYFDKLNNFYWMENGSNRYCSQFADHHTLYVLLIYLCFDFDTMCCKAHRSFLWTVNIYCCALLLPIS